MKSVAFALLALFVLLAGCTTGETPAPTRPSTTSDVPVVTEVSGATEFPSGIYYGHPIEQGHHTLRHADGASIPTIRYHGVGFDVSKTLFVSVDDDRRVTMVQPDGKVTSIVATGLFHPARPSLSPDGERIVVQATLTPEPPGGPGTNFEIFIIDLADGSSTRISNGPMNDESPEWVPGTETIVWSSFSPEEGIDLHEYWVAEGKENTTRDDLGAIHLDVSDDASSFLDPGRLRLYELSTGELVGDLKDEAIEFARLAGYERDTQHAGQANRGSFPLDGAYSPDGNEIVFDGAVTRHGESGIIVMTIARDGSRAETVVSMLPYNPAWTNNHNFSGLNPTWLR